MPKLTAGLSAPELELPAIDGTTFRMKDHIGKKIILTFFRFSSCPFCNIRINRIINRWDEFSDDTLMIGVFDAELGELKKRMKKHSAPFIIVADASYEYFEKVSVMKSFTKFLWGALRSPITFLQATLKGYFPMTLSISKLSTIPVDILIGKDGKIVKAHYCKDTADHLPIDELITFSSATEA